MKDTNHHQTSTPDADFCGELRTISGLELIAAERQLQIVKGYTPEHDDGHRDRELAAAAGSYALHAAGFASIPHIEGDNLNFDTITSIWPFGEYEFDGRTEQMDALVKAGALIVAEIDRIHRLRKPDQPAPALPEVADVSGLEITGTVHHSIGFRSEREAIERLCLKVFGATPVYPDQPAPAPSATCDMRHCPVCKPKAPSATTRTDALRLRWRESYLEAATVDEILESHADLERELAAAIRERDNAESDKRQADTDTLRALHERNEAREQLAELHTVITGDWESKDAFISRVRSILFPKNATTILGMTATVDPSLPPGTAVLRDPKTGEVLQTIKVTE